MAEFDITSFISHIEANRSVKDVLMQRLKTPKPPYRISVTDLLNIKQAYFKRKHPEIVPSLEKQQIMWAGTGFHNIFGPAVSSEEYLEQFVEAEGVVGKIDIYERIPIEVKTTFSLTDTSDLAGERPSYIEQLGMYCAMVNVPEGQIVIYQRQGGQLPLFAPLLVYHVSFPNLDAVRSEMRRRRDLLIQALISNDPSNLPVCPWFGKQCDYSQVCDCKSSTVTSAHEIARLAGELRVDNITGEQLMEKVARPQPSCLFRINDVVFPRKAYFERLRSQESPVSEEELREEKEEYLRSMDGRGFLDVIRDSLRYGARGEVWKLPVRHTTLSDLVQIWQDLPTILRDPKFNSLVERERLVWTFPHYFLRLGFECALTEHAKGRLLLYYTKVSREDAKLMVYDVNFRSLNAIKSEALRRAELLEKATSPLQLPKCPSWLCRYCDYRAKCIDV